MSEHILIPDISFWQGEVDFERMKQAGARGVVIRASQNTDKDVKLDRNIDKVRGLLPPGFYHFFEYRKKIMKSAREQAQFFGSLTGKVSNWMQALDVEQPRSDWEPLPPRLQLLGMMEDFYSELNAEKPGFYTNATTLRYLAPIPEWLYKKVMLWVAAWPQVMRGVKWELLTDISQMPKNWTPYSSPWPRATLHQISPSFDGFQFGVQSRGIDMNLFLGGEQAWQALINQQPEGKPLSLEERVADLERRVGALEKRG